MLESSPQRLVRTNLKEYVAAHVREQILAGTLRPGTKVDQDAVAQELELSKLPVREALIQLETEGLIKNRARRGAFVASLTPDDVRDHYHIYGLVAGLAAERAAERLTAEECASLESIVRRMDNEDDPDVLEELNVRLHRTINVAGGSGRLRAVLRMLAASLPTRFYERTEGWAAQARVHHRELVESIQARDGDGARRVTVAHLRAGGECAVAALERQGFWRLP